MFSDLNATVLVSSLIVARRNAGDQSVIRTSVDGNMDVGNVEDEDTNVSEMLK